MKAYPEIIKCFNSVKNGRRVTINQLEALHQKKYGCPPLSELADRFLKRLPNRGVSVVKKGVVPGELFKTKAITTKEEAFRISISEYSYQRRLWK